MQWCSQMLKKAFDTIDHNIRLEKLSHYFVVNKELSFFKSYLSNRKQSCCVNGKLSSPLNVLWGASRLHSWTFVVCYIHERFT